MQALSLAGWGQLVPCCCCCDWQAEECRRCPRGSFPATVLPATPLWAGPTAIALIAASWVPRELPLCDTQKFSWKVRNPAHHPDVFFHVLPVHRSMLWSGDRLAFELFMNTFQPALDVHTDRASCLCRSVNVVLSPGEVYTLEGSLVVIVTPPRRGGGAGQQSPDFWSKDMHVHIEVATAPIPVFKNDEYGHYLGINQTRWPN